MENELIFKLPCGTSRVLKTRSQSWVGGDPQDDLVLSFLPPQALQIEKRKKHLWVRSAYSHLPLSIDGWQFQEAELLPETPVHLGQLTFQLQRPSLHLPELPSQCHPWLTSSRKGKDTLEKAHQLASTPLSTYLHGETGTGKELLAQMIHAWSDRAKGPLVTIHCGALADELAESELFGHLPGAFTGALRKRAGAIRHAHQGTLFLDEIGDLSPAVQVKLLRFLESGEFRPLGSDRLEFSSVRLICATHHNLLQLVEEKKFRQDLYFRIASVTLSIPPLRDRLEDIETQAISFAKNAGKSVSPDALLFLKTLSWPGNSRELLHCIQRAAGLALHEKQMLTLEDFKFLNDSSQVKHHSPLNLRELERKQLCRALEMTRGNRNETAKVLGVARSTVFEMLKRHSLQGTYLNPQ